MRTGSVGAAVLKLPLHSSVRGDGLQVMARDRLDDALRDEHRWCEAFPCGSSNCREPRERSSVAPRRRALISNGYRLPRGIHVMLLRRDRSKYAPRRYAMERGCFMFLAAYVRQIDLRLAEGRESDVVRGRIPKAFPLLQKG